MQVIEHIAGESVTYYLNVDSRIVSTNLIAIAAHHGVKWTLGVAEFVGELIEDLPFVDSIEIYTNQIAYVFRLNFIQRETRLGAMLLRHEADIIHFLALFGIEFRILDDFPREDDETP